MANLALFIHNFPPGWASGAELQAQGWAERLSARHQVTVLCRRDPPDLPAREQCGNYTVVRIGMPLHRIVALVRAIRGLLSARRPLAGRTAGHGRDRGGITDQLRLREKLRMAAYRVAVERRLAGIAPRPDLLVCFMSYATGYVGVEAGHRLGIPVVVWIQGEAEYRLSDPLRLRNIGVWQRADGVGVQSEIGRQAFLDELARTAPGVVESVRAKTVVIGNGVELPEFTAVPAGGPVLSVGRLIPSKGMDVVIEACARLGLPLVIAGRGPQLTALQEQAAALGADVQFTGFVGRAEVAQLYQQASAVVLASHEEGLPNVVIEAMAHGRPVVATPVGGVPELIDDGINGVLIPPGDPDALCTALDRLIGDPHTAAQLGQAARHTAESFSWNRVQPQFEAIIQRWAHQ